MTKQIKNYLIIMPIALTIIIWGSIFGGYYGYNYIVDNAYNNGLKDGYEIGRFEQLNESANLTEISKQDAILNYLAMLESSNGKHRKILDTNNKYSLGLYHFQADTVKDMYWRYYKQKITTEEAIKIAQDDKQATELARYAIFVKNEKWHWFNSMNKLKNIGII